MNKYLSLFAVMLLAIAPLAFAEDSAVKEAKGKALTARSEHLSCAVELCKTHLDVLAKYSSQDVAQLKSDIESKLASVKDAASANDQKKFDESAKAVAASVKEVKEAVNKVRKDEKDQVKDDDAKAMKDELKKAHEAFAECQSKAMKNVADVHKKLADASIEKLQKQADELKSKGTDTSDIQTAIDAAKEKRDKVVEAAASGDAKNVTEALKELRGQSLSVHLRIGVARLRATIARAEEKAKQKEVSVDFSAAKAELDKAAEPGKTYSEAEFAAVWDSLKESSKNVKDSLKNARRQAKEDKKEEKKAEQEAKKSAAEEKKAEGDTAEKDVEAKDAKEDKGQNEEKDKAKKGGE